MGKLPSGSSLPPHWDDNMDRLICEAEGEGVLSLATIVNRVKNKFKDELREHVIPTDAIERRLNILEQRPIDYFRKGAEKAADRARANGFILKEFDPLNYPYLDDEQLEKLTRLRRSEDGEIPTQPRKSGSRKEHGIRRVSGETEGDDGIREVCKGYGPIMAERPVTSQSSIRKAAAISHPLKGDNPRPSGPTLKPLHYNPESDSSETNRENRTPRHRQDGQTPSTAGYTSGYSSSNGVAVSTAPSTAVTTPINPSFGAISTGSPSPHKRRPAPLDLSKDQGYESHSSTQTKVKDNRTRRMLLE